MIRILICKDIYEENHNFVNNNNHKYNRYYNIKYVKKKKLIKKEFDNIIYFTKIVQNRLKNLLHKWIPKKKFYCEPYMIREGSENINSIDTESIQSILFLVEDDAIEDNKNEIIYDFISKEIFI